LAGGASAALPGNCQNQGRHVILEPLNRKIHVSDWRKVLAQVKKTGMREAIIEAAFTQFRHKGYTATTMTTIAREAGMTVSNLYVYFDSKLLILYEIYRPWLIEQLRELRESVAKLRSPRAQLRRIIIGIWGDIPSADQCFANSLIEALASVPQGLGKPNDLLKWSENELSEMIQSCVPGEKVELLSNELLAHVIWMAFDGFVINRRIGDVRDIEKLADLMADLLQIER
jgi:AcrR family transcriptional regulator